MNDTLSSVAAGKLDLSLSFLLSQLGAQAAQTFSAAIEPLDLRVQDAGLLRMLSAFPRQTQVALSRTFGVMPSRMVVLLDGLEAKGLIERTRDAADRRRMRVQLSAKGRQAAHAVTKATAAMDEAFFRCLTAKERSGLRALLAKLIKDQNLQAGVHPAFSALAKR